MNYIDTLESNIKDYFNILEPNFPNWLHDYINTKEMLHQQYTSITCGTIFSNMFESKIYFSTLEHSIGVALIVWHFTHDKKQTLAGLFHDIATPVFKHSIDFLYGDYEKQEATEDLTKQIIENSAEIMALLKRDNIKVEEVCDYHIYTIADNDTPQLSADRLEYSLSNGLFTYEIVSKEFIENIYNNILVGTNEYNEKELVFHDKTHAIKFVEMTSRLSIIYREDRTRYSMQLLADIVKKLHDEKQITIQDLYTLKETEIIDIIKNSKYGDVYNIWEKATAVKTSKIEPKDVYWVKVKAKVRYIIPIVNGRRVYDISGTAKQLIDNNLSYKMDNYIWLDGIKL